MKIIIKSEDSSSQVEIGIKNILDNEEDNYGNKEETDKESLQNSFERDWNREFREAKSESLLWKDGEGSQAVLRNNHKENVGVKIKLENVKRELDSDANIKNYLLEDSELNTYNNNTWISLADINNIKEEMVKCEDLDLYFEEEETKFLDQNVRHAFIDDEDQIKSEPKLTQESNGEVHKCNLCDYKTTKTQHLKRHFALHEDPSKKVWYYCTQCGYKTRQKGHLRRHYSVHDTVNEQKKFTCALCGFSYRQKCTLRRHIKESHCGLNRQQNEKPYKCDQCPYSTSKKGNMLSHFDKHKDAKNTESLYTCDICSFSTKYRRNMLTHLKTHTEKPAELKIYECEICKFKTRIGNSLRRHLQSKKHLLVVGKLDEYCPRPLRLKQDKLPSQR